MGHGDLTLVTGVLTWTYTGHWDGGHKSKSDRPPGSVTVSVVREQSCLSLCAEVTGTGSSAQLLGAPGLLELGGLPQEGVGSLEPDLCGDGPADEEQRQAGGLVLASRAAPGCCSSCCRCVLSCGGFELCGQHLRLSLCACHFVFSSVSFFPIWPRPP